MTYLAFAIAFAAAFLGSPLVPTFVVGAGVIIAIAYWQSRHRALLRLGASFTGYALTHVLLSRLDAEALAAVSDIERSVMEFGASDKVMATVAVTVMIIAVMVGRIGSRNTGPLASPRSRAANVTKAER